MLSITLNKRFNLYRKSHCETRTFRRIRSHHFDRPVDGPSHPDSMIMMNRMQVSLMAQEPGVPWRDLPERHGSWNSVFTRHRRCCAAGLFARLLAGLAQDAVGELRHMDCSYIKLHQQGADPPGAQQVQTMGRAKGGLNTKLPAVADAGGGRWPSVSRRARNTTSTPSLGCCPACAAGSWPTEAWMLTPSAGDCTPSAPTAVSRPNAVAGNRPVSIAATTGTAVRSKTSAAGSKRTPASPPATASSPLPSSASSSLLPSSIGSLTDFENTP